MRIPEVKLSSGEKMPALGLGTWQLSGSTCEDAVKKALGMGYTHIDTADIYGNHREVGAGIKGFDRSKLFITSKVWRSDLSYDKLIGACDRALKEIGTEYLDLYLIHWPNDGFPIRDTMRAMKKLADDGKIRSAGISNFNEEKAEEAIRNSEVPIVTDQVEFHVHLYQKELLEYCKRRDMVITAYSPLARGNLMDDKVLKGIAGDHGKTVGQVSLRWLVQHGIVVIPKSTGSHLKENMEIFDWKLAKKEMDAIDSLGNSNRLVNPSFGNIPFFDKIPKGVLRTASRLMK